MPAHPPLAGATEAKDKMIADGIKTGEMHNSLKDAEGITNMPPVGVLKVRAGGPSGPLSGRQHHDVAGSQPVLDLDLSAEARLSQKAWWAGPMARSLPCHAMGAGPAHCCCPAIIMAGHRLLRWH